MSSKSTSPSERIPAEFLAGNDGKFKAKLDEADRMRCLASVMAGIKKDIVAVAFGIDRRTVSHMTNPYSKHYKSLRDKAKAMGEKAFVKEHFDEIALERIRSAKPPKAEAEKTGGPNIRAKSKAGVNVVRPEQCSYSHRINVAFRQEPEPGWWYQDLDGPDPQEWCRGDAASMQTSQDCLMAAEAVIYDA